MNKFTFITLVMILGMSSVSFGKDYLCESEVDQGFYYSKGKWGQYRLDKNDNTIKSFTFIVKTQGNDEKIESVKNIGDKHYLCKDGTDDMKSGGKIEHRKGESVKGNTFLSCNLKYLKSEGGHIKTEFVLNLKHMIFEFYQNLTLSQSPWITQIKKGSCEEI
ncbi:hypothetical protein OAJ98_02175 [Deltaproteobacteria bacterium]|nr:hypothetical protein [Deltaproteobacteria bacterium]